MGPHSSVLSKEVLQWLAPAPGESVVDGTLGFGGHAELILERLGPEGKLYGFDKDEDALAASRERLKQYGDRAMFIHDDFRNVRVRMQGRGEGRVDAMLLDLGVSSPQLDRAERGFSFLHDGPLDMRMDASSPLTAKEIVNRYPRKELERIIFEYGEERFGRRIAERIERERQAAPIETTRQLASVISAAVPAKYRHGRIHPATRTFQALRIAVNGELESLQAFLDNAMDVLSPGGRLVVISFHSLEDRAVKRAFRAFQQDGLGKILTKKPVEAGEAEAAENPRARSAKLRAFVKSEEAS